MKLKTFGLIILLLFTLIVGGVVGYALNYFLVQKKSENTGAVISQNESDNQNVIKNTNPIKIVETTNTQITNTLATNEQTNSENLSEIANVTKTTIGVIAEDEQRDLNKDELDLFGKYLETPGIWNFIYTEYKDLSEFDFRAFLKYFYNSTYASEEVAKEITGEEELFTPIHLFDKNAVELHFEKYTGKDISIIKSEKMPLYSEKYKSYYNSTSDACIFEIEVVSGKKVDNRFFITYNTLDEYYKTPSGTYVVTLDKVDGEFLFVSNVKSK